MDAIETEERNGLTIRIYPDYDSENPFRAWDQLGTFWHWHRRYDLGNGRIEACALPALEQGWDALVKHLKRHHGATQVISVGMYDHGGITVYEGSRHPFDAQGWDSGTVGVLFDTTEGRRMCGTPDDLIRECLLGELKTYDQHLTGDVYYYEVEDQSGEVIDSCSGFYGLEYAREEARAAADSADLIAPGVGR